MVYYIVFLTGILLAESYKNSNQGSAQQNKRVALFFVFLLLLAFYALRYKTISADAITYVNAFYSRDYSFDSIIDLLANQREPLFYLLCSILQNITSSYSIYFLFCALPICIGFVMVMKEDSDNFFLSAVLLISLGVLYFCTAGLRQALAMGFCYMAYPFAKKKKWLPFLILVLIAYGFHNSAFIFLLLIPLKYVKAGAFSFVIVAIIFLLSYTDSGIIKDVLTFIIGATEEDRFAGYVDFEKTSQLNFTMFIIQLAITVFCFLYKDELCKKDENANLLYNLAIVALCCQSLTKIVGEMFRVSMYFSTFLAVLVTKCVAIEKDEKTRIAEIIMIVAFCLFYSFVLSGVEYLPFWIKD